MKIRARAVGTQLQKCNPLESQANHRTLLGISIPFVPDATISGEQLRIFTWETIQAGAPESVLAFDQETQSDRELAERLLIRFNGGEARYQIAFTVCPPTREEL